MSVCRPAADGQERAMAIAVHCPNPDCAKIHQVKDKYAGTRGKCPLCGSWMYVPAAAPVPVAPKASPPATVPALDETPFVAREEPAPKPAAEARAAPARRPAPPPEPEPQPVAEPEVVVEEAALLPEEESPVPRRRPRPIEEDEADVAEVAV